MTDPVEFQQLDQAADSTGVEGLLDCLAGQFRRRRAHHELFEVLKMKVRHRLGLSLMYGEDGDELSEQQRDQLEDGLIEACREVGLALLADGKIREGWAYVRAVGDKDAAARALADIAASDDNTDELVEVLLHEGVDPPRGFSLVLENYGTCNAITTFESVVLHQRPKPDQIQIAGILVRHLHAELFENVKADIEQQESLSPQGDTLGQLVEERPWLFQEHSYHIDTTHLMATVRAARLLEDADTLRLGLDLTEYGRRLNSQFQYQGEEPFVDHYQSHGLYFQALLGGEVDDALGFFREKAETIPVEEYGSVAIEIYVELLSRIKRHLDAFEECLRLMPEDISPIGIAPSLLDLSKKADSIDRYIEYCRRRQDLLGYASGLAHLHQHA